MWQNLIGISLLQALGTSVVLGLWVWVMSNLDKLINTTAKPDMPGFILIPVLFLIAATLSAGAVLGYPIYLAFQKKWRTVLALIGLTLAWLGLLSVVLIYLY